MKKSSIGLGLLAALLPYSARAADPMAACVSAAEHGQELRRASSLLQARAQFLECSQEQCPGTVRDDCAKWLAELEAQTPSVVVEARDPQGHALPDAGARVDAEPTRRRLAGLAWSLNPGKHEVWIDAHGFRGVTARFDLPPGARLVPVVVTLEREPIERTSVATAPTARVRRANQTWAYALGGMAAALLGTGLYLNLSATSDVRDMRRSCAPECDPNDVSSARTRYAVGGIAIGAGAVALVGAAAFAIFGNSYPKPQHAADGALLHF